MKYYIWILGCAMNYSDAERTTSVLEGVGYKKARDENDADLIVVLSCSVRQKAIDRIYGKLRNWTKRKRKGEKLTIAVTGCVLPEDRKKMTERIDLMFDIRDVDKLPTLLTSLRGVHQLADDVAISKTNRSQHPEGLAMTRLYNDYLNIQPKHGSSFQALVPISFGCNNFCSYCAVPYTRGREKSRPMKEIVNECEKLIKKGYKEITLLGQNVNSYGNDLNQKSKVKNQNDKPKTKIDGGKSLFVELLKKIDNIPGKLWIRFISNHPKDMSDELIDAVASLEKVTPYVHLPLQSGNDKVLKRMSRHYTKGHYLNLVKKIKKSIPDVAISTDIIIGFPQETKKEFLDSASVMKKVKFDMAYISQYSERPGTAASKLIDDVSAAEKKKRDKILNEILKKTALANNKKYIGKTVEVLVEKKYKNKLWGRTDTYKIVEFSGHEKNIGNFVKVRIKNCTSWLLKGEIE